MTIILTNDDGIDAPGLAALRDAITGPGVIVAPKQQHSGCGHQVTVDRPIHLDKRSPCDYAVDGTPADCTRLALTQITRPGEVEWVLAGINAGGNLGIDVYMSGTVAAVREAAIQGVPGIAISHWIRRPWEINWAIATRWTVAILAELQQRTLPSHSFWNVNLPHLKPGSPEPDLVFCQPNIQSLPLEYRVNGNHFHYEGAYAKRGQTPGTDVAVCFAGNIAVTQISL